MKKTLTITTYRELFELWSTNKSFQKEYPFLISLKNAFNGKLEKNDNETSIEVYLRTGDQKLLNEEEIKTYFFPYYDKIYIKDDKIDLSNDGKIHWFYKYVMDRKLPIGNCTNNIMYWILAAITNKELKELVMYLPETNIDGEQFELHNHSVYIRLYSVTQKECYKPTAYDLLKNITNNTAFLETIMTFIKENNCVWPDEPTNLAYTFIRNNKENLNKINLVMFFSYNEDKKMWIGDFCRKMTYNKYFIDICKRYNIDINTIADNGSYLIHYAIQQFEFNPNWLGELLDNGARILDENGELLKGELGWTIYKFHTSKLLHNFLMNYYKDNSAVREKLMEEYKKFWIDLPSPVTKSVTVTVDGEDPPGDPAINALISSIQDPTIKDKMTAYYIKLLLGKN